MMEKEKKKIIIDTDCGSDDAMAIAMALNDPTYEIHLVHCFLALLLIL